MQHPPRIPILPISIMPISIMPISIMVVDDHPVVRQGVTQVLSRPPGYDVVGSAATADEALELAQRHQPRVAIVDMRLGTDDGLALAVDLCHAVPGLAVVAYTSFANQRLVRLVRREGLAGFVVKGSPPETLVKAVAAAARGEHFLDPSFGGGDAPPVSQRPTPLPHPLTPREIDVLTLVRWGHSNAEIADELGVALATVKTHVQHILQKLGARDRRHAIRLAVRNGLA